MKKEIMHRINKIMLPLFMVICMLLSGAGTVECGSMLDVKTVIGLGNRPVADNNPAEAKNQAVSDALGSSVAEIVTNMLTKSDITSNLSMLYDTALSNPQKYILTYRVLAELENNNRYMVAVESKIDFHALQLLFTKYGLINKKNEKPAVLLLISEKAPGEILSRYWWGKNPLPYKSVTEETIAAYMTNSHICDIVGNGDPRPDPESFGIIFKSILHDHDAAIKLGRELKADIIVIGSAVAKEAFNTMGDEKSYGADVSLEAFRTDTGDKITSFKTDAVVKSTTNREGIKDSFVKAGTLAGEKLGSEIEKNWSEQNQGPRTIELTIKGTDYLSSFIMLKRIMNKMDEIKDIQTKELGSDQAVADIIFQGSSKQLSDALMLQSFNSFGIEISDVTDNSLTIKFVPVKKTKPVSKSDINKAAHISE